MNGLGELIVFILYAVLVLAAIASLKKMLAAKRILGKIFYLLAFVTSSAVLIFYYNYKSKDHRKWELKYVGIYHLSEYPNCDSSKLILKENNSFEVTNGRAIFETGNWHYESGGDYWIVYLKDKEEQLGSGRFTYVEYHNKQNVS